MRHQDANLTALNYTDANLLPTFDAVASLTWEGKAPAYTRGDTHTHTGTHKEQAQRVKTGHKLARKTAGKILMKPLQTEVRVTF